MTEPNLHLEGDTDERPESFLESHDRLVVHTT